MSVALASQAMYVPTNKGVYVSPTTWKLLSRWWCLFRRVQLLLSRLPTTEPPNGWVRIPGFLRVRELVVCDDQTGFLRRRRTVLRRARQYLKGVKLIYVQMPSYEAYWTFRVAQKLGIPILVEFHGDWEEGVLCQPAGTFLKRLTRRLHADAVKIAYMETARKSLAIVTIGPALARKYVPREKPLLITTNHTMSKQDFVHRKDHALKDPPRILFVGKLCQRKGLILLFSALRLLNELGRDFELVVVGQGPERNSLSKYAKVHGFGGKVSFLGYVPNGPQLFKEYRKADVFVLPSIAAEGVPRVIQEALALGCPVIATDIGSIQWQLKNGAGLVVRPGDPQSLKENILHVLDDENLRRALSERGFAAASEHTSEHQASQIDEFVRSHVPDEVLI